MARMFLATNVTLFSYSLGTHPRIMIVSWVIVPETGTTHIAHMGNARERSHYPATVGVLIQFALGILHAVFLFRSKHNAVFSEFRHSETLMFILALHRRSMMELPVLTEFVLPRLLDIMQKDHEQQVRERERQWTNRMKSVVENDSDVHYLLHMIKIAAGPILMIVRGSLNSLKQRSVLLENTKARSVIGLIDHSNHFFDGEVFRFHDTSSCRSFLAASAGSRALRIWCIAFLCTFNGLLKSDQKSADHKMC